MAVLEKYSKRQDDVVNDMRAAIRTFLDEHCEMTGNVVSDKVERRIGLSVFFVNSLDT